MKKKEDLMKVSENKVEGLMTSKEAVAQAIRQHYMSDMYINQKRWWRRYRGNEVYKESDNRKSINASKMVCYEMASLILNEKVQINIGNEMISDFIRERAGLKSLSTSIQHKVEQMFAIGGLGGEVVFTDDGMEFNFIRGDRVIPLRSKSSGEITDVAFLIELQTYDKDVYSLVRTHEKIEEGYLISNLLFKGDITAESVEPVQLSMLYPHVAEEVVVPTNHPLFSYVRPNIANNIDLDTPLGISIVGNSQSVLEAIDTKYDSFCYEFEVGKKKIIIPEQWMVRLQDGSMVMPEGMDYLVTTKQDIDNPQIVDVDINLRVDEHISAINKDLDILATQTGFNTGSFSFENGSMKTATEVMSQNSRTFKTKKSHEVLISLFLKDLIIGAAALGEILGFGQEYRFTAKDVDELEVTIDYDDSIVEDKTAELDRTIKLLNAGLTSRKKALMMVHSISEPEAERLLEEIMEEEDINAPDIESLLG